LSIIMPLSWFPLIADYTSQAKSRTGSWLAPFIAYCVGSSWMYAIGFIGALYAGTSDPAAIMVAAGLGLAALSVVGLSTITTTFMDVYSAAVSTQNVFPKISRRWTAVVMAVLGTILGMFFNMDAYVPFLLILGSVFAPLVAILLSDYFLFKRDARDRVLDPVAWMSLLLGIAFYHGTSLLELESLFIAGHTLTTIIATVIMHGIIRVVQGSGKTAKQQ
ncbi:MAG: putative hydroxymethylpyrimidine transporter CytX, partial [Desulfovibrio sp.]